MEPVKPIKPDQEPELYRLFIAVTGLRANQRSMAEKGITMKTQNVLYFENLVDHQIDELAVHFFGPGPNVNLK